MEVDKHAETTWLISDALSHFRPRSAEDMIAKEGIISLFLALMDNQSPWSTSLLLHGPGAGAQHQQPCS